MPHTENRSKGRRYRPEHPRPHSFEKPSRALLPSASEWLREEPGQPACELTDTSLEPLVDPFKHMVWFLQSAALRAYNISKR